MDSEVAARVGSTVVCLAQMLEPSDCHAFDRCPSSAGQSTNTYVHHCNTYVHHWTCGMGNCGPAQSAVGHVEL